MSAMLDGGDPRRTRPTSSRPGAWWVPASHGGSAPTLEEAAELDAAEKRERAAKRAAKRRRAKA